MPETSTVTISPDTPVTPVGFTAIRDAVLRSTMPVVLLTGPEGIGKSLAVQDIVVRAAPSQFDRLLLAAPTISDVREVTRFVSRASMSPKVVGIDLDGAAPAAQHGLLKTLEEPPARVRFVLSSSGSVLDTIVSRSQVVVCPPLTRDQVVEVLVHRLGQTVVAARAAADLAGGRVSTALGWGDVSGSRVQTLNVLKAIIDADIDHFRLAVHQWSPPCRELAKIWAVEVITGKFSVFSPDTIPASAEVATAVLTRLSVPGPARTAVHSLTPVVLR